MATRGWKPLGGFAPGVGEIAAKRVRGRRYRQRVSLRLEYVGWAQSKSKPYQGKLTTKSTTSKDNLNGKQGKRVILEDSRIQNMLPGIQETSGLTATTKKKCMSMSRPEEGLARHPRPVSWCVRLLTTIAGTTKVALLCSQKQLECPRDATAR